MPTDPHIIPRRPREIGAASRAVDLERRIRSAEATNNFVGEGASVTGGWIGTADTGASVYLQGPLFGTPGLFITDSSGTPVIWGIAGSGIGLTAGTPNLGDGSTSPNTLNFQTSLGGPAVGVIGASSSISGHSGSLYLYGIANDASHLATLTLNGNSTSSSLIATTGSGASQFATILNSDGCGIWGKSIGFFGVTPPTTKPATPASLADVTAILQGYGMCA